MPTALVVTADMGGNLPPVLGLGRALTDRGWTVLVHGDEPLRARAGAAGLGFETAHALRYDATLPRSTVAALRDIPAFWSDRGRGRDVVDAVRRIGADVAVVDTLLLGTIAELEAAGVPTVVVVHSTWEGMHTFFGGPIGAMLRIRGIDAMRVLARAGRVLVASDARLGRPSRLPVNAIEIGPILQERPEARAARTGRPLVLLSLSTVAFPGQRETLQRLLDAVAPLPIDVVAATGAVDATGLRAGGNTVLGPLVDHGADMPRAAAVISHGGHATTVRSLAHGLPLLLVPMHPLMDQPRIARAVEAAGAGLVVPKSGAAARFRSALERLLAEPSFAEAARGLGADFIAADGASRAADEVERAVESSRV